uniref:Bidirectional sugar transporter SWEET n=1 Tax=Kalanchoe fedtschenkoi TaxID=63787 RepID=A0A7N0TGD7_KALFE
MPALSFIVGLLGNLVSVLVFTSPIGTFRGIVKKKSIQDYKAIPYITTLLSTSLWTFYGLIKPGGLLIYTINGAGALLQMIYVTLFLVYAPRDKRISMMKLVAILNVGAFGVVVAVALSALHGNLRLTVVGVLCAALTIGMYAAPLSVMRTVVKTESVEYMPFFLSLCLFINAAVWTAYAFLVKDFFVGVPNVIGFFLGSAQLILYAVYSKNKKTTSASDEEDGEAKGTTYFVTNDDLEMQNPNKSKHGTTSLYKDLSLPKMSKTSAILNENGVKNKIIKAMSLSSYELQAIVLSAKEDDTDSKKN